MAFFEELKRRNVVRVGIAYCVIAWVIAQLAEFAFENFGAPDWVLKTLVVVLLLGLPLALIFAWAFELTPDGVKLEKKVDASQSITPATGRKLDRFIIAALVVALAYFVWERQSGAPVADKAGEIALPVESEAPIAIDGPRSIAVLPFVNMSSDVEQEYFSDGLTEEILNALARTPDLLVASRTSSFKFKNTNEDITTIADALGVEHVLEGSVRRDANRLRVTAQLIRAKDGFHLWSQTYDRKPEDVIAIQEDVAIDIATALETAMDPQALAKMMSAGTSTVAAYNAYLEGLGHGVSGGLSGNPENYIRAREDYERAVALDPGFALAHWALAKFWEVQGRANQIVAGAVKMSKEEMRRRLDASIAQAIEHEQDSVSVLQYRVLLESQNLRLNRALALNTEFLKQRPNDIKAQYQQLGFYTDLNMPEKMRAEIAQIDQREALGIGQISDMMLFSFITNDRDFIRHIADVALQRMGDSAFTQYQAHRAFLWTGDIEAAKNLAGKLALSELPDASRRLVALRQACAEDDTARAQRIYTALLGDYSDDTSTVWLSHKIMGMEDAALATLLPLDEAKQLDLLMDYTSYAYFDPRPFVNLMTLLDTLGVEPREPLSIPYQCKT